MTRGVIYMYTSPSNKSYIGQTYHEEGRRKLWNSSNYHYAGTKVDRARAKYGSENFKYTLLFEKNFASKEIAMIWLNIAEQYYIQLYDTVSTGYNCEGGGGGNALHTGAINHHHGGYKLSEDTKKRIGEASRKWQNTPEAKIKMGASRFGKKKKSGYRLETKFKPVVQLTMDGTFVNEFDSIRDAGESFQNDVNKIRANISIVCKGKRFTAGGYRWMYKEDYYDFFLHPEKEDIPKRVQNVIDDIISKNTPKIKKKYKSKPRPKKVGPKINTFAKKVGQYDENYNLVKIWRCATEAAKQLGIHQSNLSRAVRTLGRYKGSYWRIYEGKDVCDPKPKKIIKKPSSRKRVVQMDLQGNLIQEFESIGAACSYVGATHNTLISRCLNGKAHTAYGYKWKFLNCA